MRHRFARLAAVAATWTGASLGGHLPSPFFDWPVSLSAFAAVALLPGWFVAEALARGRDITSAGERPARALALSVASATLLGLGAFASGGSIEIVIGGQLALTLAAVAAVRGPTRPARREFTWSGAAVLAAALALAAMSAGATNIARDRMWYMAYVTDLSAGGAIDWTEPFLGSDHVVARFAHNGWLLTLAAWQRLAGAEPLVLFEQKAPLLLALLVLSAALAPARALFGAGTPAAVGALASVWVLLSTRFPFFAPDRYPLFGRLPEDKTTALLVLLPVALAACADRLRAGAGTADRDAGKPTAGITTATLLLLGSLTAVAGSHAIVYLVLLISCASLAAAYRALGVCGSRTAVLVVAMSVLVATGPAAIGLAARGQIVEQPATAAAFEELSTHPVVRSHDRMARLVHLRALPHAGPIVDPGLVGEPLLACCLVGGLLVSIVRRRAPWAGFLLIVSAGSLALAFLPWVSPAFGRLVVPWMAYRALWGIPFGLLLAAALLEGPALLTLPGRSRAPATIVLVLMVGGLSWAHVPWARLVPGATDTARAGLAISADTRTLLREIAALSPASRIAAAPGFAELVPALAGRRVLAFSDRGTVVFAGTRSDAERRMRASAALIALHGASRHMRNRIIGAYDVTHTVYADRGCDRRAVPIARAGRLRLCAERLRPRARRFLAVSTAVAARAARGELVADLEHADTRFVCRPAPSTDGAHRSRRGAAIQGASGDVRGWRWKRDGRWSARPLTVDCVARPDVATRGGRIRFTLALPRAREAVVYRVALFSEHGAIVRKHGVVEFRDNPTAEIRVPDVPTRRLRVRLAPAYLPYLNVKTLEWRR